MALRAIYFQAVIYGDPVDGGWWRCRARVVLDRYLQGESKKSGISKSMYIALRAIKIKQIKF